MRGCANCRNAGRHYTGCYCRGRCKNRGQLMPSPTTTGGLLGHFPRGADPPANDRRATTLPLRSLTSSFLMAILAAWARGSGAWAGASGRRATREVGRGGTGGDDSKVWSRESRSSKKTSDAESEEGEEEPRWVQEPAGAAAEKLPLGRPAGGDTEPPWGTKTPWREKRRPPC